MKSSSLFFILCISLYISPSFFTVSASDRDFYFTLSETNKTGLYLELLLSVSFNEEAIGLKKKIRKDFFAQLHNDFLISKEYVKNSDELESSTLFLDDEDLILSGHRWKKLLNTLRELLLEEYKNNYSLDDARKYLHDLALDIAETEDETYIFMPFLNIARELINSKLSEGVFRKKLGIFGDFPDFSEFNNDYFYRYMKERLEYMKEWYEKNNVEWPEEFSQLLEKLEKKVEAWKRKDEGHQKRKCSPLNIEIQEEKKPEENHFWRHKKEYTLLTILMLYPLYRITRFIKKKFQKPKLKPVNTNDELPYHQDSQSELALR